MCAVNKYKMKQGIGRDGGIRTHDPQSPRLMRYQAALHPDRVKLMVYKAFLAFL